MEPVPEPAGSRARIPDPPSTRAGAWTPGTSVLVALRNAEESRAIVEAFRRRGWIVEERSLATVRGLGPDLILTDEIDLLAEKRATIHPDPNRMLPGESVVFALSDCDDESVAAAWKSGVDWVVWRPFDPDNPMGTKEFVP